METITLTASITYPVENIEKFADNRGYQGKVKNPDYVPPVGKEFLVEEDGVTPQVDADGNFVVNPEYVPAVGTSMIDNPQTRIEFVKEWFKAQAVELFAVDFKKDAQIQGQEVVKKIEAEARRQLADAITIV